MKTNPETNESTQLDMPESENKLISTIVTGFRAISASIPGAASIATVWAEWESKKKWEFITHFFEDVQKRFNQIESEITENSEYFQSEEVAHLTSLVIEKVMRERNDEKRKRFADFYLRCLETGFNIEFDDKRFFLEVLDQLNEFDLVNLLLIKDKKGIQLKNLASKSQLDKYIISISKLQNNGLISETNQIRAEVSFGDEGDSKHWTNRWLNKWFQLIPSGEKFISFLIIEG